MKENRLLVISLDALGAEDVPVFEKLPNFGRILKNGAACFNVSSVYPVSYTHLDVYKRQSDG